MRQALILSCLVGLFGCSSQTPLEVEHPLSTSLASLFEDGDLSIGPTLEEVIEKRMTWTPDDAPLIYFDHVRIDNTYSSLAQFFEERSTLTAVHIFVLNPTTAEFLWGPDGGGGYVEVVSR